VPRYARRMGLFLDSFWRAAAYCLHPRVIALSFLPLVIMVTLSLVAGYFFWHPAVESLRMALEASDWMRTFSGWLSGMGARGFVNVIPELIIIFAATPVIVLLSLLVVAALMAPVLTALVALRRFPDLERKRGGSVLASVAWAAGSTLLAMVALVVSLPLWLIPPLVLVLPPLIWGWLTYRVMAFDALATHASREERRAIFLRHRGWLLGIGVLTGYLGAAPSVLWASGALFAAAFIVLIPLAIWIYTLVFAFSSLWFAHFCLAALAQMRAQAEPPLAPQPSPAAPDGNAIEY